MNKRPLAPSVAAAAALFVLDGLLLEQGLISMMVCLLIVFVGLPWLLVLVILQRKPQAVLLAKRIVILTAGIVMTASLVRWNTRVAERRATQIIVACHSFHDKYN